MPKTESKTYKQEQDILDHLKQFGSITPQEALREYGCMRLSARIMRLRRAGHEILTEQEGPHDYATYRLIDEA